MNTSTVAAAPAAAGAPAAVTVRCRICDCKLSLDELDDDFDARVCASCVDRPEARRLGLDLSLLRPRRAPRVPATAGAGSAREFTQAEISLISKVHSYMPPMQLLDILNERLRSDLGDDARPYTMDQLQAATAALAPPAPAGGHDWASLRKVLARARRDGVLGKVTGQLIDDFAVVYSLNARQVMALKDVLLAAQGDAS